MTRPNGELIDEAERLRESLTDTVARLDVFVAQLRAETEEARSEQEAPGD